MVDLAPNLTLVIDQLKRELVEGYRPVFQLILNGMRILLHKLVASLGEENVIAVRTDCVYTTLTEESAKQRLKKFKFRQEGVCTFDDIGSLRFDMGVPPVGLLSFIDRELEMPNIHITLRQKQIYMENEYDDEQAKRILEDCESKPLLVVGKYPGTGKSQLALNWGNKRKDMLVVCPTNVLCDEIKKQDYTAITVYTLLGIEIQVLVICHGLNDPSESHVVPLTLLKKCINVSYFFGSNVLAFLFDF